MTHTTRLSIRSQGDTDVIDITPQVAEAVRTADLRNGVACVFVVGSTASITTTEAEPGLLNHDLKAFFQRVAPDNIKYVHEETWSDDNGHSHVRASFVGPSVAVPVIERQLTLGRWQQIVLIDFDTRPRTREIIVQLVGDSSG